jgi:hypothetical protein
MPKPSHFFRLNNNNTIDYSHIYGIYLGTIIKAVSLNEENLHKILEDNISDSKERENYFIKEIKLLIFYSIRKNNFFLQNKFLLKKFCKNKMFGFSKKIKFDNEINEYEECLICFLHKASTESMEFKNYFDKIKNYKSFNGKLTENYIIFDKFYILGIMNN